MRSSRRSGSTLHNDGCVIAWEPRRAGQTLAFRLHSGEIAGREALPEAAPAYDVELLLGAGKLPARRGAE